MLASNAAKPSRERLTLIRIFEALRGLGYEGGYDAVRGYARVWPRDRAAPSVGAFILSIGVQNWVLPHFACCSIVFWWRMIR
jgi:hypothetical protein